jgi:rod shape-determining protein MreC
MRDLFRFLYRARNTLLFAALMAIALLLLYNGNMHHRAQAITSSNAIVGRIYTWRKDITDYANLKDVNQRLAEENAAWRSRYAGMAVDSGSVVTKIDTLRGRPFAYQPAKVVNSTWHKQKNYITLDRGSRDGIEPDMGVIGPYGILGVVKDVSPHFASVISILSPDIRTSVQMRRTGHFGLLYWDTGDPRTASVIDIAKHARVAHGDTVETRGGDGIFPAGVNVGVVEQVTEQPGSNYHRITIRLTEDLTRSGYVYAVRDLMRAERDSLLRGTSMP